jgi:TolB-like protein
VLAFASDDKGNEYFSDGISEELLNVLAKIPGLRVTARTSAFHFKGRDTPIPEIAKQLGVAYVVEGSVRKAGSEVRIAARLIDGADGVQVWADNFREELKDVFALQDKIAGLVARNLALKLGTGLPEATVVAMQTRNLAAYDAYLRGRALQTSRIDSPARAEMIRHFETAIGLDPAYALAWARLSQVHVKSLAGANRSETVKVKAREAATTALRLSPELPEAHLAMAEVRRALDYDLDAAQRELAEVDRLRPNDPEVAVARVDLARVRGQWGPHVLPLVVRAEELDPQNAAAFVSMGYFLSEIGQFAEAARLASRAQALSPADAAARRLQFVNQIAWTGEIDRALATHAATPELDLMLFHFSRAEAHADRGDFPGAIADFEKARAYITSGRYSSSGPRSTFIRSTYRIAQIEAREGRQSRAAELYAEALKAARQLARDFPEDGFAVGHLAILHALHGESAEARAAIDETIRVALRTRDARDFSLARRVKAETLTLLGETDAAIAELRVLHEMGVGFGYLLRLEREWEPLRSDAKFQQLMKEAEARADAQPGGSRHQSKRKTG